MLSFHVNPFPNKPWFLRVCSTSPLKTLWEKEKLLVTSNFSFSHSVFYSFRKLSAIFIKFEFVVCRLFQFGRVLNLSFGKGLSLCRQTDGRTDGRTDRRTMVKQYAPDLMIPGHKKEKLLVTSNFSFSHNFFYPIQHLFSI